MADPIVNPVTLDDDDNILSMASIASQADAIAVQASLNNNFVSNIPTNSNTGVTKVNGKKVVVKTAAILMIYKDNKPVCYYRSDVYDYDIESGVYSYVLKFNPITNDLLDENNNILLEPGNPNDSTGCHFVGGTNNGAVGQVYVPANAAAKIFLLSKFTDAEDNVLTEYEGYLELVPNIITNEALENLGLKDYIVTNVYEVKNGIDFFENFSEIVNCTVAVNSIKTNTDKYQTYTIKNLPVIRRDYTESNTRITEFLKKLKDEKDIIDKSLEVLEDQYQIDLKFFNTYGPAHIYYTSDENGKNVEVIDRVNITLTFGIKLKKASDDYTASYIMKDIKDNIENMQNVDEYHLDNLAAILYNKYQNSIYYIEFRGFNDYDSNRRHFFVDEEMKTSEIPPEFININLIIDGENVTPDINVPAI